MNRRLTIGSLQIYFDEEGYARHSPGDRTLESVEAEIKKWQEFVERWLQTLEPPPKSRTRTGKESDYLTLFTEMVKSYKRAKFPNELIETAIRTLASISQNQPNAPTEAQMSDIVQDAIDSL